MADGDSIEEGDAVTVKSPHKDYQSQWLLPGEIAYVIDINGHRCRVRCPASGADMWLDGPLLEKVEVK